MNYKKFKFSQAEINHILGHLVENTIDRDSPLSSSWYYGNKEEFIRRHKRIKRKLGGGE